MWKFVIKGAQSGVESRIDPENKLIVEFEFVAGHGDIVNTSVFVLLLNVHTER